MAAAILYWAEKRSTAETFCFYDLQGWSHENSLKKSFRGDRVPKKEVCKKKSWDLAKKWYLFHNFNIGRLLDTKIFSSLYDQGTPERSRGVQEAGNMFLAQIRVLRNEPPRPQKID